MNGIAKTSVCYMASVYAPLGNAGVFLNEGDNRQKFASRLVIHRKHYYLFDCDHCQGVWRYPWNVLSSL